MNPAPVPFRILALALFLATSVASSAQTWSTRDIGSVGKTGSWTFNSTTQTHTVKGAGADIWGTADAFRYVHQPLNGDGEITARVASQTNTNAWAKAGVMVRESVNSNSKHASVFITPGSGVSFQSRAATGGNSASTTVAGPRAPYWVKIVRSGANFSA